MSIGLITYNTKYRLEYISRGNYQTKIEIKFKNYTGSTIDLIGSSNPLELVYESNDENPFGLLKSSFCNLIVKETPELKSDFIEIEDEDNIILEYYRDNNLMWSGYILQEQYVENDDPNNPFITLKFYDAISRLRIYNILDLPTLTSNELSLYELLYGITFLLYANMDSNTDVLLNDFLRHTEDQNNYLLSVIHIYRSSLFDTSGNPYDLYEVLTRIGLTFGLTFLKYQNNLLVSNFSYSKNPKIYNYNTDALTQFNTNKLIDSNHYWIEKSKLTNFWDSLKKVEVFHKYTEDPSFYNVNDFGGIQVLSPYLQENFPVVSGDTILFNSYADEQVTRTDPDPNKSYKDVNIFTNRIIINNLYSTFDRKYRFQFNIRMEFDYGITDEQYNSLTTSEKIELEQNIKELENNTEIRYYFQLNSIVSGTTYYFNQGRSGNYTWVTSLNNVEINSVSGLESIGFDQLVQGYNYIIDIPLRQGLNELETRFFHPYVYTDTTLLSPSNQIRIQGVNTYISQISFSDKTRVGIEEERYEGKTDRNVFNYNQNRDREYFYTDINESKYQNTLINSSSSSLVPSGFRRYEFDLTTLKNENLTIYEYLIFLFLNQFGKQQEYITGTLKVFDDPSFDILSVLEFDGKSYGIHKFNYNDKQGVYQIELIEIKYEL